MMEVIFDVLPWIAGGVGSLAALFVLYTLGSALLDRYLKWRNKK